MRETIEILNRMESEGVIGPYCIAGAVAALQYVEASLTEDLDVLVSFGQAADQKTSGLITLTPILGYLGRLGYSDFRDGGILIEGWPVQFLPVASNLDNEALANAQEIDIGFPSGSIKTRLLRPEYIVANALKVGRPKDRLRAVQFIEEGVVAADVLCAVVARHGLLDALASICNAAGIGNPCTVRETDD